jgi:hypothetical protein
VLPTKPIPAAPAWTDPAAIRGEEVLSRPAGALTRIERARLADLAVRPCRRPHRRSHAQDGAEFGGTGGA